MLPPNERVRRPFKYINAMRKLPQFLPMVKEFWNQRRSYFIFALYRFSKKLKNLKPLIREMGRDQLGNLSKRAKEAHDTLCEKHKQTFSTPNNNTIQEEAETYEKWFHIADLEEDYLKKKEKLHWLEVGDQNNKSFHSSIKSRQAQNAIHESDVEMVHSKNSYGDKKEAD